MSTKIKPQHGVTYECYKGFTDSYGDYCRPGQKFKWSTEHDEHEFTGYYVMEKASGRGVNIAVKMDQFAAHFCPANMEKVNNNFKVGDRVKIKESSEFYGTATANPAHINGVIEKIKDEYLGIFVKWDNEITNSYDEHDLELVNEAESEAYLDVTEKLTNMIQIITVNSEEQIKELAKISFLKDQLKTAFPELFVTHKVGNRYKHEDGNRYILVGGRISNQIALVNLKTGKMESYKVAVDDADNITASEFSELCFDSHALKLIKERQ
jgi:hypothetical protein